MGKPQARGGRRAPAESRGKGRASVGRQLRPAYDFTAIEAKWSRSWEESRAHQTDLSAARRPYYNLMMFPYPSAEGLHIGNMYPYVGSDVQGRWRAMQGYDVFEPIGFDAFGIHSENFAIKQGVHPRELTARNVGHFRQQLRRIGNRFDWSHEISTSDPTYYRWTQWIFVQLLKAGLAERRRGLVNWCPHDKTVLADEQVIAGRCERCGTLVERKALDQWYLKITRFADRLLDNLDGLDWSERVKAAQRHWIGRSAGAELRFAVHERRGMTLDVFTSRPDTVFGVTFLALAADHPAVDELVDDDHRAEVEAVRRQAARDQRPSWSGGETPTGGAFTGAYVVHPLAGERVPIWVADYVVGDYGTGAIMGVPAHDARDWAFAAAHGIPVKTVVVPPATGAASAISTGTVAYTGEGIVVDSGELTGLSTEDARRRIITMAQERGVGREAVRYHLRDWLISRQRYWGPPIPVIYCPTHGAVPVPEEQLPVLLPPMEGYRPVATGASPLADVPEFVNTTCPVCGEPARRETDVSDNSLDSAWYYLRYPSSGDQDHPWDRAQTRRWLPVDMYVGGAEHSVLHMLYARFIAMALHDLGHLDFDEPFVRFRANGMITRDGAKMSKSKGNVVAPDEYISRYGADAFRTYMLFMGQYEVGGDFSDRGLGGVVRFLNRAWAFVTGAAPVAKAGEPSAQRRRALNAVIRRVTADIEALKYNTAIASLMGYLHELEAVRDVARREVRTFLLLLAPFAPFITEDLWHRSGESASIHTRAWPTPGGDESAETVTLVVQVNGRLRDRVAIPADAAADDIERQVLALAGVRRFVDGRAVRRIVHVPGKLVNLVVDE